MRFLFGVGGDFYAGEDFEHFLFCWGIEDVAGGKVFGLGIGSAANAVGGVGEVVGCVSKLNIWAEQQPIGTGSAEGHSDAAGIYDAGAFDFAVELHMGVAAHDCCGGESFEDWGKAVFGGQFSEDVVLVLRGGVAEEDGTESTDFKGSCFWPHG